MHVYRTSRFAIAFALTTFVFASPLHAHEGHVHTDTAAADNSPLHDDLEQVIINGLSIRVEPGANPWTNLNLNNNPDNFQFAIISDHTGSHREGVWADAISKVNMLQPEFLMCVGDLIEGYTEDVNEINAQWEAFMASIEPLEMPFFFVPGNHDITNSVMAGIWQQRFGRAYHHFVYRDVLFLCVNSEDGAPETISPVQQAYFANVLNENPDVRWTLVFMHKPLWIYQEDPAGEHHGWDGIERALNGRPYTVFAGHRHTYMKYQRQGQNYYRLATTGGGSNLRGVSYGEFDHITWVTMTPQGPRVANLLLEGILADDIVTPDSLQMVRHTERQLRVGAIQHESLFVEHDTFTNLDTALTLTNPTAAPARVQLYINPHHQIQASLAQYDITLESGASTDVPLTLLTTQSLPLEQIQPLIINVTTSARAADNKPVTIQQHYHLRPQHPPTIPQRETPVDLDGDLNDWSTLRFAPQSTDTFAGQPKLWQGRDDADYRFDLACDDQNLYVAVHVTDDVLVKRRNAPPWHQDGLEVHINALPEPHRSNSIARDKFNGTIMLAMTPSASPTDTQYLHRASEQPEGLRAVCVQTQAGYIMEAAVPLAYLRELQGGSLDAVRVNLFVSDLDDQRVNADGSVPPVTYLWWNHDWRSKKHQPGSGTFKMPAAQE